jgi:hypothetical protein
MGQQSGLRSLLETFYLGRWAGKTKTMATHQMMDDSPLRIATLARCPCCKKQRSLPNPSGKMIGIFSMPSTFIFLRFPLEILAMATALNE